MRRKGRQIIYKTPEEIELIRQSCLLVCKTLAHVGSMLRPGMTGAEADEAFEEYFERDPKKGQVALGADHLKAGRLDEARTVGLTED